ncbi:MAG TPA: hypothetical protein VNA68_01600 [Candidatus Dormibacteraeota bacterium]|nr:hypothetical protein [Candidatus Dormibacteraeota bacterium]
MSKLILQTAKIIPRSKRLHPTAGSALSYCYEPPKNLESLGSLIVVIEVLGPTKKAEEIIDTLIQTAGETYYTPPTEEGEPDRTSNFESTIQALNEIITKVYGQSAEWADKIHAVIAVAYEDSLIISSMGNAQAYLYRGQHAIDLTEGLTNDNSQPFESVASGTIQTGDQLVFATPGLMHKVPQTELRSIASNSTPQTAVSRIGEILKTQPNLNRTSGLIASVTTPELLAMQVLPNEPSELHIEDRESFAVSAQHNLKPFIKKTAQVLKNGHTRSQTAYRQSILPLTKKAIARSQNYAGKAIRGKQSRKPVIMAAAAILLVASLATYQWVRASEISKQQKRYQQAYTLTLSGQQKLGLRDKAAAEQDLQSAYKILDSISKSPALKQVEAKLQSLPHEEQDPASVTKLKEEVAVKIDKLQGLIRLQPQVIKQYKNSMPVFLESVEGNLIVIGQEEAVTVYNAATSQVLTSAPLPKGLGVITASAVSDDGGTIYILTEEPAVWVYQIKDNRFERKELSQGSWARGRSIASYNNSLYVLDDAGVHKHIPTLAGFSSPSTSISSRDFPSIKSATSIAIDGSIYISGGGKKVERFLVGQKTHEAQGLPQGLSEISEIKVINLDTVAVFSRQTAKIGIMRLSDKSLSFEKQYSFEGYGKAVTAVYEAKTQQWFTVADNKLIKAKAKL